MTDQEPGDRAQEGLDPPRRPWSKPALEVLEASDAEGPVNGVRTDSITGIS
jgi:hypothetical protein